MTVVLVEQNCTLAFQQADEIYVLERGRPGYKEMLLKCETTPMSVKPISGYEHSKGMSSSG
jgi:ABC-type branched-subunit amino acid transport system ATPase component